MLEAQAHALQGVDCGAYAGGYAGYVDSLERLLLALDGVEARGCGAVRARRRAVVVLVQSVLRAADEWKLRGVEGGVAGAGPGVDNEKE